MILYRFKSPGTNFEWSKWSPMYEYNLFHDPVTDLFAAAKKPDYGYPITKLRFEWGKHGIYDFKEVDDAAPLQEDH